MSRFSGGCEPLCRIEVDDLIEWIGNRIWDKGSNDRPYVMVDPLFLEDKTDRVVSELMPNFPGCKDTSRSITVLNAGDYVPYHTDNCFSDWITRIHVPIVTNPHTWFLIDGLAHHMEVGMSYQVNPSKPHAVSNAGDATRIHLMFDIVGGEHGNR
jgi:hypothetical protein